MVEIIESLPQFESKNTEIGMAKKKMRKKKSGHSIPRLCGIQRRDARGGKTSVRKAKSF